MHDIVRRLVRDEGGATAVEYGLLVGAIAVAVLVGFTAAGGAIQGQLLNLSNHIAAS